jgi:hypothetical protein
VHNIKRYFLVAIDLEPESIHCLCTSPDIQVSLPFINAFNSLKKYAFFVDPVKIGFEICILNV